MASFQSNENWQIKMRTLFDSAKFLFNNKIISDVTFVFNIDGEEPNLIFAHSWILSMLSPIFYNSFKNNFEVEKEIPITESSYMSFLECLRFVYTGECSLTGANVFEVMTIAKKYSLEFLEGECVDYISKSITTENACETLNTAILMKHNVVKEKALQYIALKISPILKTISFLNIRREILEIILSIEETGPITEIEFFEGAMKWAENQCIIKRINVNSVNKRQQLGNLFKKIRFTCMTSEELGSCIIKEEGILSAEETQSLLKNIVSKTDNNLGFETKIRTEVIDLEKFPEKSVDFFSSSQKWVWSEYPESLGEKSKFTVNRPVYLTKIYVGRCNVIQDVIIEIKEENNIVLQEVKINLVFAGVCEIKPMLLKSNQVYIVNIYYINRGCKFVCIERKNLPRSIIQDRVEFRFTELSHLLHSFGFKMKAEPSNYSRQGHLPVKNKSLLQRLKDIV